VLDSYEPERRTVGKRNVDAAGWAAEGMMMWRALWGPEVTDDTAKGAAKRAEIGHAADLHHRRAHEMIGVELGYSYAGSDLIAYEPGNVTGGFHGAGYLSGTGLGKAGVFGRAAGLESIAHALVPAWSLRRLDFQQK
jgi:hypothetical protein